MNYGDLQTYFLGFLNRRDIAPSLAMSFLQQGIIRTQRLLDVPASEVSLEATITVPTQSIPIPPDLLKLVAISVGGVDLVKTDISNARLLSLYVGSPSVFGRDEFNYFIGPAPAIGTVIQVCYQADFSVLVNATDSNWLTQIASEEIKNAAMVIAMRYYADPRWQDFEQAFAQGVGDINMQAANDELANAVIAPGISFSQGDFNSYYGPY